MGILANSGRWLRKLLVRWLGYAFGLCVVLVIFGAGAFILFRPSLMGYAEKQIGKYGIETGSVTISPLGQARLEKVRIPLSDGGMLTAETASGRPPLPGVAGTASLYNVILEKGNLLVFMPELYVGGISLAEKDMTFSSRTMQQLMRVSASSVTIPEMHVTLKGDKAGKAVLRDVKLGALDHGKIGYMTAGEVDATLEAAPGALKFAPQARQVILRGHDLSAESMNLVSAYRVMSGEAGGREAFMGMISSRAVQAEVGVMANDDMQRFKISLASFEVKPGVWRKRFPQSMRIAVEGMQIDTTQLAGEAVRALHEMGYGTVDVSLVFDASYDEAAKNLVLNDVSFKSGKVGSASFKGVIGNVDKGIFSGGQAGLKAVLDNARFVRLDMTFADDGIIDRVLSWETTQVDISKEELRGFIEEFVALSVADLLKSHRDVETISGALKAFMRDSGSLQVHIAAKQAGGIRLLDALASENGAAAPGMAGEEDELSRMLGQFDLGVTWSGQAHKTAENR